MKVTRQEIVSSYVIGSLLLAVIVVNLVMYAVYKSIVTKQRRVSGNVLPMTRVHSRLGISKTLIDRPYGISSAKSKPAIESKPKLMTDSQSVVTIITET